MRRSAMRIVNGLLMVFLASLTGCVGLVVSTASYQEISIDQKHKAEVLARFGEPARREEDKGLELWSYKLIKQGVSGAAVDSTTSIAFLILVPVTSTTKYEDNFRVYFRGDDLVRAEERRERATGAACGIPSHMFPNGCLGGVGSEKSASTMGPVPPASAPH